MAPRRLTAILAAIVGLLVGSFVVADAQTPPSSTGIEHYGPVVSGESWTSIAAKYCPGGTTAGVNALMNKLRLAVAGSSTNPTLGVGDVVHVNRADVQVCLATVPPSTTSTSAAPTTTTTVAPTTSTTVAPTTTTTAPAGRFGTLPVGSPLPTDADCASRVRPAAENRAAWNTAQNATRGRQLGAGPADFPQHSRINGNFVGTTDQILQWAACKWGIDEDAVRAQAARESWWEMTAVGDGGESFGILQVRLPYHPTPFPEARTSTAMNADYTYALWRSCFEGHMTWLNTVERGRQYAAGDLWGCMGTWFAGRWYAQGADQYIAEVQRYMADRIWTHPSFIAGNSPPSTTTTGAPPSSTTTVSPSTTAPTTTSPTTSAATTTTSPASTTTTAVPSTTSQPTSESDFFEDFSTPQGFYGRFRLDVHFRDPNSVDYGRIFSGDHNHACQGPTTQRDVHVSVEAELFWWCAPAGPDSGHVMTGMADVDGYTILSFSPNRSFTDYTRVCWDVNATDLGGRKWIQALAIPLAAFNANGQRLDYISPTTSSVDQTALPLPAGSFMFQLWDHKIRTAVDNNERELDWFRWTTNDKAARYKHCMVDNNNGTVTVARAVGVSSNDAPGGIRTVTVPGSLPNNAVIIFQDDNYTPEKDGPIQGFTWHWDNVEIS